MLDQRRYKLNMQSSLFPKFKLSLRKNKVRDRRNLTRHHSFEYVTEKDDIMLFRKPKRFFSERLVEVAYGLKTGAAVPLHTIYSFYIKGGYSLFRAQKYKPFRNAYQKP
jgi:hypothetical protein